MPKRFVRGMTLTELLVATSLLGIIMLGVVSVSFAFRRLQQSTSKGSLLAMQTSATLLHITKNASLATGTRDNLGIQITPNDNLCVRQDVSNPNSFTDDTWRCYTRINTGIYTCNTGTSAGVCTIADERIGTVLASGFQPTLINDSNLGSQEFGLTVTLINNSNPSLAQDPITNPQIQLFGQVYPRNHSF